MLALATFGKSKYKVRVCMTFKGQTACKVVSGAEENAVLRTAVTDACADVAGGVTDTVNCQSTPPQSVTWLKKP